MIQVDTNSQIITSMPLASAEFSLDQDNLPHVFHVLRNMIYSNKIMAVIREYSTNAYDANVENNADRPFVVTMPTITSLVFKVRDFGKGLSEAGVVGIFASYGASTKRFSNDYVGFLGFGSKSAFCYSETFSVVSYHGGKKTTYHAYIDESNIGTIAKLHEEVSDAPTGLEICIPVKMGDIENFKTNAITFFQNFLPLPEFVNSDIPSLIEEEIKARTFYFQGTNGVLFRNKDYKTEVYVKMGNVMYPLRNIENYDLRWLPQFSKFIMNVEIGEISFTTSREEIQLTAQTVAKIKEKIQAFKDEVKNQYVNKIDTCKDIAEAWLKFSKFPDFVRLCLSKTLTYKGNLIPISFFEELNTAQISYIGRWQGNQPLYVSSAKSYKDFGFIVNDGNTSAKNLSTKLKIAHKKLRDQGIAKDRIYFIKMKVSESKELLENSFFQLFNVVKLSEINATSNAKGVEKIYKFKSSSYYHWEEISSDQYDEYKETLLLVKLKSSYQPTPTAWGNYDISSALRFISAQEKVIIVGARKNVVLEGAIPLEDYLATFLNKIFESDMMNEIQKDHILEKMRNKYQFKTNTWIEICKKSQKIICPVAKELFEFFKHYQTSNETLESKVGVFLNVCKNVDEIKKTDFVKRYRKAIEDNSEVFSVIEILFAKLYAKYPLLTTICSSAYINTPDNCIDYINALYSYKKGNS